MLGILLDFRVKPLSAKLNDLRVEDRIINAAATEFSIFQPELIYCNVCRLAKIATALDNNQIYTARVLICIIRIEIEKITSSPMKRY